MRTQTRDKLLQYIESKGKARPSELKEALQVSAQAVHRHLRRLVQEGVLETQGSPPFTHYALVGRPDFERWAGWINPGTLTQSPADVCETREVLIARLPHLKSALSRGLSVHLLPLVIGTAGEVGNNSFDHNLGQWRDVPGCWFESQITGSRLWVCMGDRGQGILQSLARAYPQLVDDQEALKMAFESIASGRAPEKRGNGLKFVRNVLTATQGAGLACLSGNGRIAYGDQGEKTLALLVKYFKNVAGTVTLMNWRLA